MDAAINGMRPYKPRPKGPALRITDAMKPYIIRPLDNTETAIDSAATLLAANCPNESDRYDKARLLTELSASDTAPFYRQFFAAYDNDNVLIGVGGIKSADWASDTHILYLMAVDQAHRGIGVGSALEKARLKWLRQNFKHGRCLVSTRHKKRFVRWDFACVSEIDGRHLMLLEF